MLGLDTASYVGGLSQIVTDGSLPSGIAIPAASIAFPVNAAQVPGLTEANYARVARAYMDRQLAAAPTAAPAPAAPAVSVNMEPGFGVGGAPSAVAAAPPAGLPTSSMAAFAACPSRLLCGLCHKRLCAWLRCLRNCSL